MGLLLLSVLDPMDRFYKVIPRCLNMMKVYVDDFIMNFRFNKLVDTRDQMRMRVAAAFRKLNGFLERNGAKLAQGKSRISSNSDHAIEDLMDELNHCTEKCLTRGVSCKCTTNHRITALRDITVLGVDCAAGKMIRYDKLKEREINAIAKGDKIVAIAPGGWRLINIMRAHVVSTITYGARVNGIPDNVLTKIRAVVRNATSTRAGGGSATADMALQRCK